MTRHDCILLHGYDNQVRVDDDVHIGVKIIQTWTLRDRVRCIQNREEVENVNRSCEGVKSYANAVSFTIPSRVHLLEVRMSTLLLKFALRVYKRIGLLKVDAIFVQGRRESGEFKAVLRQLPIVSLRKGYCFAKLRIDDVSAILRFFNEVRFLEGIPCHRVIGLCDVIINGG